MLRRLWDRLGLVRGDANRSDRIGALHRAWGYIFTNQLVGDYYEFGVYRGDSMRESFRQYRQFVAWLDGQQRSAEPWRRTMTQDFAATLPARFIGCDTFAGIPENNEGATTFRAGNYACDEATVRRSLRAIEPLTLVVGPFADRMIEIRAAGRTAAIIHLDCDLYASARDALCVVTPLVQQGTVLLCDDYRTFANDPGKGTQRALREWQDVTVEPWFPYHHAGQAFLLHRPASSA